MAQATLNGQLVNDGGKVCEVRFQWGGSASYGHDTPWIGGYTSGMTFSATITNLAAGAAYHFRAQARNSKGIGNGQDMVFATLSPVGPITLISDELLHLLEARA